MTNAVRLHHVSLLLDFLSDFVGEVEPKLAGFITYFLMQVPEPFFTAPASSSGKYHPDFAHGEGGLFRHTLATMEQANRYSEFLGLDETSRTLAVVAAMLHDTYKGGDSNEWTHTVDDHGPIAAVRIRDLENLYEFVYEIADAVENHMGRWTPIPVYPQEMDDVTMCVAMADYAASFAGYDIMDCLI